MQGRHGVLIALAGVLALLAGGAAAAQGGGHIALPDDMPGDRLLVFHRTPQGDFELHTVNWDASERTVLTPGGNDFAADWSPDGRHVAFHRVEAPADGLYVVASDGTTIARVDDWAYTPSWSPDAQRLVYSASLEAEPRPLRITSLDGASAPVPGTTGGTYPRWSPDGARIAYLSPQGDLTVVHPDGSDRRVVAHNAFHHDWSPDAAHLAYVTDGAEGAPGHAERLMMVRRDGAQARQLAQFERIVQPVFSPTGRDLAIAAATADSGFDIWRIELADGTAHQRTNAPQDELQPRWTAGGSTIVFTRADDLSHVSGPTNVWATNWAVGPPRRVTDSGADLVADVAPGRALRVAGPDRIATAVQLSRTFPAADTVVIARADDHPDALAGAPLAGALDAPVLLTGRDRLHPSLQPELRRLGVERAYLLGGHRALSPQVEQDLADLGITDVARLAGDDRFATAAAVADELRRLAGTPERVFVVEGRHPDPRRGWPDALSASGVAALASEPILLVTRDHIPAATLGAVRASGAHRALIVGGPGAVSPTVQAQLREHVDEVARVAGGDRYETSARAADLAVAAGGRPTQPWLATGLNWPDALAAAPAMALDGGALLLVDGRTWRLPPAVESWLTRGDDTRVWRATVVGGPSAVRPEAFASIETTVTPVP